jgi:hypothetical protein
MSDIQYLHLVSNMAAISPVSTEYSFSADVKEHPGAAVMTSLLLCYYSKLPYELS